MTRRLVRTVLVLTVAAVAAASGAVATPAQAATCTGGSRLQTVPALPGVRLVVNGLEVRTDATGCATLPGGSFADPDRVSVPPQRVSDDVRITDDDHAVTTSNGSVQVGLRTYRLVTWAFQARGDEISPTEITSMTLRSSMGEQRSFEGPGLVTAHWVQAGRTQRYRDQLVAKDVTWSVTEVLVTGSNVVTGGLNRFTPTLQALWTVQLLYYLCPFTSSDLLFGTVAGDGVALTMPNGETVNIPFDDKGIADPGPLPRGEYEVTVFGGGIAFQSPLNLSRDQDEPVVLRVITPLDLTVIFGSLLLLAVGLVLLGRPPSRWRRSSETGAASPRTLAAAALAVSLLALAVPAHAATGDKGPTPFPVLAYYYIWFTPTSWDRAKIDYPLLGRYSSADPVIMRKHIELAKSAGIDGFLVSWKNTPDLNARLATLTEIADEEGFSLGIVYQGLDFARQPLQNSKVRLDLDLFADTYAKNPVFDVFGKPLVIWTGSYLQTPAAVARVVAPVSRRLLVLGSAKSVDDYEATADILDGNAYYWSSVDPAMPGYQEKLVAMGTAVHANGGLWIPPFAPGFDARLVGGSREIPRDSGQTLRREFAAAVSSNPDALGLISWNEFSENSHVEPSENYGHESLAVLADLLGTTPPEGIAVDSSESFQRAGGLSTFGALTLMLLALALVSVLAAAVRRGRLPR